MAREYSLVPRGSFAGLFAGFSIARAAEVLETYSGHLHDSPNKESLQPATIHATFLTNSSRGESAFERYYRSPYAEVDTYLEVLYYVVIMANIFLQSTGTRQVYLDLRPDAQRQLIILVRDLFGFDNSHATKIDDALANRARLYAPDSARGIDRLSEVMEARVKTNPMTFARAAFAYTFAALADVFGALLVYDKGSDDRWSVGCIECGSIIAVTSSAPPERFSCGSCGHTFTIGSVYE